MDSDDIPGDGEVQKEDRSGESMCENCLCYPRAVPKVPTRMCGRDNGCGTLAHSKVRPEMIISPLSPNTWFIKAWAG